MAKNFIQPGSVITVTAPAAVSAGEGVEIGHFFGVAQHDAAISTPVECMVDGVHELAADAADTFNEGELVYWDDANTRVTVVAAVGKLIGYAVEDKATPTVVKVRLNGGSMQSVPA
jgi:predicted RecA/RadA family phage recombinase